MFLLRADGVCELKKPHVHVLVGFFAVRVCVCIAAGVNYEVSCVCMRAAGVLVALQCAGPARVDGSSMHAARAAAVMATTACAQYEADTNRQEKPMAPWRGV